MVDIVERLRERPYRMLNFNRDTREAASEIERLRNPDISTWYIGPLTFQHVFQAAQLHNMADIQAVMDAVEMALKNILDTA